MRSLNTIARQITLIVAIGMVSTAVPGALAIYSLVKGRILDNEAATLSAETKTLAKVHATRLLEAENSLRTLATLLSEQLLVPPDLADTRRFDASMKLSADGVWRNLRESFDGMRQAGVFMPVARPDPGTKSLAMRVKQTFEVFGAGMPPDSRPNVWLLTPDRSEITFDRAYPDFVYQMNSDTDYTKTPWMTLGSPVENPERGLRFTPPLHDPVSNRWLVSAVRPLDLAGRWIGTLGHDIEIGRLLREIFGGNQRFKGEKHFLIAQGDRYVLAGPWQKALENSPKGFRPDLDAEPGLAGLLNSTLGDEPRTLDTGVTVQGIPYVVVGMTIQPLGWRYFRLVPRSEILAPVEGLFLALVGLVLLVGVGNGILVNRMVGRRIALPMHDLTQALREYGSDTALPRLVHVLGHDEIATASRAFNEMVTSREAQQSVEQVLLELDQHAAHGMDGEELMQRGCERLTALGYAAVRVGKPEDSQGQVSETTGATLAVPFSADGSTWTHLVFEGHPGQPFGADARRRMEWIAERFASTLRAGADHRWLRLQGAALSASASAIFITNGQGTIEWVNESFVRVTGFSSSEAVGSTPRMLKSGTHGADYYARLWQSVLGGQPWHAKVINRRRDGTLFTALQTITPIVDPQGKVTHMVAVQEDISEMEKKEAYILHQATHDVLTGLGNRVMLIERLQQAMTQARQGQGVVSLMFIDLDQFKYVNDSLGHGEGDKLLVEVSKRLQAALGTGDTLTRFGGDEFIAIVTSASNRDEAGQAAARLLNVFVHPFDVSNSTLSINASIGISLFPEHGHSSELLIQHADAAMYQAKSMGRNQFQFFSQAINDHTIRRHTLEREMRHDLEHGGFELHYQLQCSMDGNRPVGAEALVRWHHGNELRMPMEFIPIAEETGMIFALGEWVLREACEQAQRWANAGLPIGVAVNLSARQFADERLIEVVRATLAQTGLRAELLELELTESAAMQDPEKAIGIMQQLKALGVRIALDDFGTGYSNLIYLMRLPVDKLKTDRSFIRHIETDPDNAALFSSVVKLAHVLRMTILPEGVETEGQRAMLHGMGADYYQGYLLARPMPAAEFENQVRQRDHVPPWHGH